ncbi:hypothetical protein T492DRAFT_57984 [Pavlovales sp. CCMP2436]|nr:hypothetical protein T492DRAFT_57984 [Pavlovales sp. CCMP2436]
MNTVPATAAAGRGANGHAVSACTAARETAACWIAADRIRLEALQLEPRGSARPILARGLPAATCLDRPPPLPCFSLTLSCLTAGRPPVAHRLQDRRALISRRRIARGRRAGPPLNPTGNAYFMCVCVNAFIYYPAAIQRNLAHLARKYHSWTTSRCSSQSCR